jgi:hypothetical protein
MARRVFFSFHFANDFWRTHQVRNINALDGQTLCSANDWEEVKRKGDAAIKKWIDDQMYSKSCVVVLIGAETANRPWVTHEISKGWNDKRAVLGIRVDSCSIRIVDRPLPEPIHFQKSPLLARREPLQKWRR